MASQVEAAEGDILPDQDNHIPGDQLRGSSSEPKNRFFVVEPLMTSPESYGDSLPAEAPLITEIKAKMSRIDPENQEAEIREVLWDTMFKCGLVHEEDKPSFQDLNDWAVDLDKVPDEIRRQFNSQLIDVGDLLAEGGHLLINLIQKAIDSYGDDRAGRSKMTPLIRRVLLIVRVEQNLAAQQPEN